MKNQKPAQAFDIKLPLQARLDILRHRLATEDHSMADTQQVLVDVNLSELKEILEQQRLGFALLNNAPAASPLGQTLDGLITARQTELKRLKTPQNRLR